jgi:hypothetical protein
MIAIFDQLKFGPRPRQFTANEVALSQQIVALGD